MFRLLRAVVLAPFLCWVGPSLALAANCAASTTITATGAGSCTVPAGVIGISFKVWGAGASGDASIVHAPGGGGGGECSTASLTVTPGATVYWTVGIGGVGVTVSAGNPGGVSWVNIAANSQPASGTNGCYATGGLASADGSAGGLGGAGNLGATNYSGGPGGVTSAGNGGSGGGGGAGSGGPGGAGGAGPSGAAGAGGTPDGGNGSAGDQTGNTLPGTQPGGASGGQNGVNNSGNGGAGQLAFGAFIIGSSVHFLPMTGVGK